MKFRMSFWLAVLSLAVLVAACAGPGGSIAPTATPQPQGGPTVTPAPDPTSDGVAHGGPVTDFESLVQNLLLTGAPVEPTDETIEQPFFSVQARIVRFNGSDLQVFEYPSEAAADADVRRVAPDGTSVGTSMITWMATPHFFKAGRFTVLYVGDDATTLTMLEAALGGQFAGGEVRRDEPGAVPATCVPQSPDRVQYPNPKVDYCLLHPAQFQVNVVDIANVLVEGPAVGEGPQPVRAGLNITVVPAEGRDLTPVVDEVVSEYAGLPITRNPGTLGGEAAEIVEGLPGVTGSRDVFAVHEDRVYRLRFYPVDPAFPQVAPDVDELWGAVIASFAFLPKAFTL